MLIVDVTCKHVSSASHRQCFFVITGLPFSPWLDSWLRIQDQQEGQIYTLGLGLTWTYKISLFTRHSPFDQSLESPYGCHQNAQAVRPCLPSAGPFHRIFCRSMIYLIRSIWSIYLGTCWSWMDISIYIYIYIYIYVYIYIHISTPK